MTNAIAIEQPRRLFADFTQSREDRVKTEPLDELVLEASRCAAQADEETARAGSAADLMLGGGEEASDREKQLIFARIAVWHYERATLKYQASATKFVIAATQQRSAKMRERFRQTAGEMSRRAAAAATAQKNAEQLLAPDSK